MGHLRGKKERCFPVLLKWDGFLKVLSVSDLKFLSLIGVENPDKHRTQWELTKKKWKMVTKSRSSVI